MHAADRVTGTRRANFAGMEPKKGASQNVQPETTRKNGPTVDEITRPREPSPTPPIQARRDEEAKPKAGKTPKAPATQVEEQRPIHETKTQRREREARAKAKRGE